ncbi:MAG TPA: four helix bundle protein [Bacteroidota bacterium]|nr:four helix bundle protein [Bacteroidota bacterium]
MAKVNSFRDLIVWQKAMALSKDVYLATKSFPREEIYGITSQLRRASVSVAANIAEGQARSTTGEFVQFLGISRGSVAELETLITLSKELGFISEIDSRNLTSTCEGISKLIVALRRALLAKNAQ